MLSPTFRDSDLVRMRLSIVSMSRVREVYVRLRVYISNKFPHDAVVASLETTL